MMLRIMVLASYIAFAFGFFVAADHLRLDAFSTVTFVCSGMFFLLFVGQYRKYQSSIVAGKSGERAVAKTLKELNVEALHDIYLPGPNGSVQLDHVALFPGSLAVIETKNYNGVFRTDSLTLWQRVGRRGRIYKIANPIRQLEAAKFTLGRHLPTANIWGLVVMAGRHTFLDKYPKNVKSLRELRDYILYHRQQHGEWRYSEGVLAAWQRLKDLKLEHASLSKNHVREARQKRGERLYMIDEIFPLCLWLSMSLLSASLTALAYYEII